MRTAYQSHRRDANHRWIVDALKRTGCSVWDTSQLGSGFPDVLVRCRDGRLMLLEIKSVRGQRREPQRRFQVLFPETRIVRNIDEALDAVGML